MPWLVGTALMHSLAVTEKRGAFRSWTVFLAILAFSLSLLGTFLVRSGVLTSVHAFATDPKRGIFILAFLTVVVGSSFTLFAWRASKVGLGGRFALVSRESMLLTNNALLLVAAAAVLLGTLYPLVLDAFGLGKISVGPPYFEAVFVPLMAPALFLMGVGPLARWKQASLPELAVRLRWALAVSFAAAIVVPLVMGRWSTMVGFGISARHLDRRVLRRQPQGAARACAQRAIRRAPGAAAARLLRHAARAPRGRRVHRRRNAGEGIRSRDRRAHGRGRYRAPAWLHIPLCRDRRR